MPSYQSYWAKKVQRLRKAAGLTQEELAEKYSVSRAYMATLSKPEIAPSIELLEKIARALRVDIKELFLIKFSTSRLNFIMI